MEKLVYLTVGTRFRDWFITTYKYEKTPQQTCDIIWDVEYPRTNAIKPPTVK